MGAPAAKLSIASKLIDAPSKPMSPTCATSLTAVHLGHHQEGRDEFITVINLNLLPLGWAHFIASLAALAVGVLVLLRTKGTSVHRQNGRIYALAVLVISFTALGIYRLGSFFFAHWFGVAAVVATLVAVAAAHFRIPRIPRVGWMNLHLTCMLVSFYILIGRAVNEVFYV
jgi:uncharacterized membrane protein